MSQLSIKEIIALAVACPSNSIVIEGNPGCGKTVGSTSELKDAGYHVTRIDAQNVPTDWLAAIPVIGKDKTTVHMASHDMWTPRPSKQAFLLDELFKAEKHIIDAFLPLVFGREFMGHKYADDTIVIITSNGTEFNLGDRELPHMGNRTTRFTVRDMTVGEATNLMVNLSIDRRVLTWVEATPSALVSFDAKRAKADSEAYDYYGYSPQFPRRKFCSLRSLEMASTWLKAMDNGIPASAVKEAVSGAIGERASNALFKHIADTARNVPTVAEVMNGFDCSTLKHYAKRDVAVNLACCATKDTMQAIVPIVEGLGGEFTRLFTRYVLNKKWVTDFAGKNKTFDSWITGV